MLRKFVKYVLLMIILILPSSIFASSATLLPGSNYKIDGNGRIVTPDNQKNTFLGMLDELGISERKVKSINRVGKLPSNVKTAIISTSDSEVPIYAYYDTTNSSINIYSTADVIYANENSSFMFFIFII